MPGARSRTLLAAPYLLDYFRLHECQSHLVGRRLPEECPQLRKGGGRQQPGPLLEWTSRRHLDEHGPVHRVNSSLSADSFCNSGCAMFHALSTAQVIRTICPGMPHVIDAHGKHPQTQRIHEAPMHYMCCLGSLDAPQCCPPPWRAC